MVTKTKSSPRTEKEPNSGASKSLPDFVGCELNDVQKAHCKNNILTDAEIFDTLDRWLRDGFKLSLRYEERSLAVASWLTGPEKGSDCSGLVLSARGPSISGALTVLAYKHFEVLAEDWRQADIQGAKRDSWG